MELKWLSKWWHLRITIFVVNKFYYLFSYVILGWWVLGILTWLVKSVLPVEHRFFFLKKKINFIHCHLTGEDNLILFDLYQPIIVKNKFLILLLNVNHSKIKAVHSLCYYIDTLNHMLPITATKIEWVEVPSMLPSLWSMSFHAICLYLLVMLSG
jgi:hypothetical protein